MILHNEKYFKILEDVLTLPTAPLYEDKVVEYILKFASTRNIPFQKDIYGNLIFEYHKGPIRPALGFLAHMDHPGFEFCCFDKDVARLRFLGGAACPKPGDNLLYYLKNSDTPEAKLKVVDHIHPEESKRPTHVIVEKDDVLNSKGFAVQDVTPFLKSEDLIHSRSVDDLAGCAALLALLDLLYEKKPDTNIYIIFTRAEELGFVGSCGIAMAHILPKTLPIICLEASKKLPTAIQGEGVVIRVGDRFSVFDPEITSFLMLIARQLKEENENFKFQRAILDGGTCEASLFYTFGYKTSGLALPLGCYHNNGDDGNIAPENIHLDDWYYMVELMWASVTKTERLIGWKETAQASFIGKFSKFRSKL